MTIADRIVAHLRMLPHPEGGHYLETFRDEAGADGRSLSTAILFLLKRGEQSRWHRVDAAEIWHYHAGDPLELRLGVDGGGSESRMLGPDLLAGQSPQIVVRKGQWQAARSLGEYTLVGCTVAPGFLFSGFELAAPGFEP